MEALFPLALPVILKNFSPISKNVHRDLYFYGLKEKDVDPKLRELEKRFPNVNFGIYPGLGLLNCSISAVAKTGSAFLDEPYNELKKQFGKFQYEAASGKIEEAVQDLFIQRGWTLAIAESCTGGAVASRLTAIPGASNYFLASFVTYANSLKSAILGVPLDLIQTHGAVSQEVALAMCQGVFDRTGCTHAAAITGIAGPDGGTKEKPVGTVWFAVCAKGGKPYCTKVQGRGTRQMIITYSTNFVLSELIKHYG
jgi:nicotinamide-nucleotide amidase